MSFARCVIRHTTCVSCVRFLGLCASLFSDIDVIVVMGQAQGLISILMREYSVTVRGLLL